VTPLQLYQLVYDIRHNRFDGKRFANYYAGGNQRQEISVREYLNRVDPFLGPRRFNDILQGRDTLTFRHIHKTWDVIYMGTSAREAFW
jgi:hypothetical protein